VDPVVIAALITAAAGIVSTTVSLVWANKQRKRAQQSHQTMQAFTEEGAGYAARALGFRRRKIEALIGIRADGTGEHRITLDVVSTRRLAIVNNDIHTKSPKERGKWQPTLEVHTKPEDKEVRSDILFEPGDMPNKVLFSLIFIPPLEPGEDMTYTIGATVGDCYHMSKACVLEEMKQGRWPLAEPVENWGCIVQTETDMLVMEVSFPEDFVILPFGEINHMVVVGDSKTHHHDEEKRISQFIEVGRKPDKNPYIRAEIPNPIPLLKYYLVWDLPMKR